MYRVTIGLEIHAELKTRTKMFCGCKNDPDEKSPNFNVCPVCMAHPGALPVINKQAVRSVLRVGAALSGKVSDYTRFDRKNYFYPDIPKGYQISQYEHPLVQGGSLKGVSITRIHLEEDTARSQHSGDKSLVDFNRAGVPLMELVTEPQIRSAAEAGAFARELQLLLRYVGAGEANMEKGEMRVEANISMGENGKIGTKVEIKNLNSFRSVERAILYEIERQSGLLEHGEKVEQETRGWDDTTQKTFSQRKKEFSHDYRYFPDPDLPYLRIGEISEFSEENLKKELPELPWQRRERYMELGLKKDDADMFVRDSVYGDFFDEICKGLSSEGISLAANYIANDLAGQGKTADSGNFRKLITMVLEGRLSSRGAKDTLALMFADGRDPEVLAKEKGLVQQSDESALATIAQKVIAGYPDVAKDYKAGKEVALQFLIGKGMMESKGSANPQALREAIQKILA
ncbi:MAG: Aspartyl/glutamyl-tRNA(Asn/Gln) amidotransferase subunit B [Candidatus Adlerbacteria bacterium GW2011_GWA1_54_10]|uniref:Aspartyl/glutamyl-tRNA(Asn/Gln) amidotransferase subunit B n=3 Tax=Candidatus Adleribacteriota TaxID=1752736 RepID=A0A1F4Y0G7_9BACT|nr:MAG: Aspartyl/glutamyl-tRNA(Asn/Gln) amidotransferase subunit B [Candidatus Adlerbacteria bacterium GW2011_GWA1_54_10]KKW37448.1 MAG: Aspartyl/glutamyl-tRNA(Asn/Gln) amidotransferase subunit B [Candidatus Adlerbacteria bacterium GW2011_GWB1_54_7]OGC87374.1 MAG: glutaminyl-tRNA synthase (glutamine-hydrolyzing) subunit B [Candidatus Adlerbacteria bacterium RIFCSPLOWO2_01_FULL_54_16]